MELIELSLQSILLRQKSLTPPLFSSLIFLLVKLHKRHLQSHCSVGRYMFNLVNSKNMWLMCELKNTLLICQKFSGFE